MSIERYIFKKLITYVNQFYSYELLKMKTMNNCFMHVFIYMHFLYDYHFGYFIRI